MLIVYKEYDGEKHQQEQELGTIISTNSFGLAIILDVVELESSLNRNGLKKVLEVKHVSERLIMVKLQTDNRTVAVVSVYAPQIGVDNDEKCNLY